jgi:hypothetical protein
MAISHKINFDIALTLTCPWRCRDCMRGANIAQPDSDVTPDQIVRLIEYFHDQRINIRKLYLQGGEPLNNPWLNDILQILSMECPSIFKYVRLQTAYSRRYVRGNVALPRRFHVRCDQIDGPNYKARHRKWLVSPTEIGVLSPDAIPPTGTEITGKSCHLQTKCGRGFEKWGFLGCSQEGVIGRFLGIDVHSSEYRHWSNPDVCRHCPATLPWQECREIQDKASRGQFGSLTTFSNTEKFASNCRRLSQQNAW